MRISHLAARSYSLSLTTITAGLLGLSLAFGWSVGRGDAFDYSVTPKATDNFVTAAFRFVNPGADTPESILVFIPGTNGDGRGVVTDPKYLAIAKACHAAVIGCSFTGIERGYDQPSGGTGQALDDAISHFAAQLHQPGPTMAPLLLIGHCQGGNFTYNYICWKPERVKAFAATKWMSPGSPKPASFQVPGLIATGENDTPGRRKYITLTFAAATGRNSKWAFLYEKGAGHELGDSLLALIQTYFSAVCLPKPGDAPTLVNAETGNSETPRSVAAGVCWFPNQASADAWKALHKPTALESLSSLQ